MIIDEVKRRGEKKMGQSMTHGMGNMCKRGKRRKGKRGRHTSNSGLSSNIGRVIDLSLCLDCQKKKGNESTRIGVSRKKTLYKNDEDEEKLEIRYFPLSSGGCRRRRCLPLAASGSARRRSISRWPQSSRHRLACSRASVGTGTSRRRRRAL